MQWHIRPQITALGKPVIQGSPDSHSFHAVEWAVGALYAGDPQLSNCQAEAAPAGVCQSDHAAC